MKIANTTVKYISGPISFDFYTIRGQDLLIFGDKHDDMEGMCDPCSHLDNNSRTPKIIKKGTDCYTLSSFVQNILEYIEGSDEYLDLYVESYYSIYQKLQKDIDSTVNSDNDGRLGELIKFYGNCKKCKNIRFHHIDIRNITTSREISIYRIVDDLWIKNKAYKNLTELENSEITDIGDFLENLNDQIIYVNFFALEVFSLYKEIIVEFMVICANSKDFIIDCEDYMNNLIERLPNYEVSDEDAFEEEIKTFFNPLIDDMKEHLHIAKNYNGMILHPIGKQFRKLIDQEGRSELDIENMVEFLSKKDEGMWDEELTNRLEGARHNYDVISEIILDDPSEENVNKYIPILFENVSDVLSLIEGYNIFRASFVMDIYAFPRILYNFENSKMKIVSVGLNHAKMFSEFIDHFYPHSNASTTNMLSSTHGHVNTRCLDMSKLILKK